MLLQKYSETLKVFNYYEDLIKSKLLEDILTDIEKTFSDYERDFTYISIYYDIDEDHHLYVVVEVMPDGRNTYTVKHFDVTDFIEDHMFDFSIKEIQQELYNEFYTFIKDSLEEYQEQYGVGA